MLHGVLTKAQKKHRFMFSMAKAYAADAFTRIGIDGIELHGALGYTWEYDAQLYLKRSKWAKSAYGGSDYHYDRVASLGGL